MLFSKLYAGPKFLKYCIFPFTEIKYPDKNRTLFNFELFKISCMYLIHVRFVDSGFVLDIPYINLTNLIGLDLRQRFGAILRKISEHFISKIKS